MDQIREYAKRPLVVGIATFVVGLIIGLVVLGWGLWPVQWYDASPENLHPGYQEMWLRMAIISYGATGDAATAKVEYDALGTAAADTLARVKASPGGIDPNLITQFEAAVSAIAQVPPSTTAPGVTPTVAPAKTGRSNLTTLLIVMCVVTLLVGAAIVVYFVLQGRKSIVSSSRIPISLIRTMPAGSSGYRQPAAMSDTIGKTAWVRRCENHVALGSKLP